MENKKEISIKQMKKLFIFLLLSMPAVVIFGQLLHYGFVSLDDHIYITKNYHVKSGFSTEGIKWAFTTLYAEFWHPVIWLSHMSVCELFGLDPGMHHLANIILHIVNTLLLFNILFKMTGACWRSAFVAALFSLHPLNVEPVAWISARKDILSTFFLFLTIWAYINYSGRKNIYRYILTLIFFSLGLMSKPMLVTLPFALLLFDYWPLGRLSPNPDLMGSMPPERNISLILEKVPLLILAVLFSLITLKAQYKFNSFPNHGNYFLQFENAFTSYCAYLFKMVYPVNLAIHYPYPKEIPLWKFFGSIILLLFLSVLFLGKYKRPYTVTGWLWFVGTLFPVAGFVKVGYHAMADRYSYVPLIGMFLIAGWGGYEILEKLKFRKRSIGIIAVSICLSFMFLSWNQTRYWSDNLTLFEHALNVTGNNSLAHVNIGNYFFTNGRNEEARVQFGKALESEPGNYFALTSLGSLYMSEKKYDKAMQYFEKSLSVYPGDPDANNYMGCILMDKGKYGEAAGHFEEVLALNPYHETAHFYLGKALISLNKLNEALNHFQKAIKINPDLFDALYWAGKSCMQLGLFDEASNYFLKVLEKNPGNEEASSLFEKASKASVKRKDAQIYYTELVRKDPGSFMAHYNLAVILAQNLRTIEALEHFTAAHNIRKDLNVNEICNQIGVNYMKQGKTDEAVKFFDKSLEFDPDYIDALNNIAAAYESIGKTESAARYLFKILDLNKNNANVYFNLGNILNTQGKTDEAIKYYTNAIKLSPDFVDAHNNMAIALFNKGEIEKAIFYFREATRIDPDNVRLQNNLKKALAHNGSSVE